METSASPTGFVLNGTPVQSRSPHDWPLLAVLREELGLSAPRLGCGLEQCGACHVLVDGRSVPSCTLPLDAVQDKAVWTLEAAQGEGSEPPRALLRRLQAAFLAEEAAQCGYCTSGLVASAAVWLSTRPVPDEASLRLALDRHLCRCGAHARVLRAVLRVAREMAQETQA